MIKVKSKPGPAVAELQRTLRVFSGSKLRIGILDGTKPHDPPEAREEGAPAQRVEVTIGEIAARHEFGIGVPERSFLRGYFHENSATVAEATLRLFRSRGANAATLEVLGAWIVGQIQTRISNRIPPPNAPETIARKGSDVPLIDTGQLRSSVTHKVEAK